MPRSKPKLILHIGFPKTGTTTLQRFFSRNLETLQTKYKINYNQGLSQAILDFESGKIDSVRDAVAASHGTTCELTSNEEISTKLVTPSAIEALKVELSHLFSQVTILCYIRRQDEVIRSSYLTALMSGSTDRFFDAIQSTPKYNIRILQWAECFGLENIHVRRFQKSSFIGGDLISDICHYLQLPPESLEPVEPANFTPPLELLEFMRLANIRLSGSKQRRQILKGILYSGVEGTTPLALTLEQAEEILSKVALENTKIAQRHFKQDTLFEPPQSRIGHTEVTLQADQIERLAQKILSVYGIIYEPYGFATAAEAMKYVAKYLQHITTNTEHYIAVTSQKSASV